MDPKDLKIPEEKHIPTGVEYPTDPNAKKLYAVGCYTPEDWDYIHEVLTKDGTLEDNIPCDCVECADLKLHSSTRAVYLLTDEEAEQLKNHSRVEFVHEDYASYTKKYKVPPEDLTATPQRNYRYENETRQYRNWVDSGQLPGSPGTSELNRSGYQLLRCVDKADPWYTGLDTGSNQIFTNRIQYYGDGSNVDLIVGDEGCWFGHAEFQNNATGGGPTNYVGGNVLKEGFAPSATTGTCDLLDVVLDGPYYIDPDWFEADSATRLTLRWDGTTVPTDTAAYNWWTDSSQRSVGFSTIGTVPITSSYTRAACNGSNSARPTITTQHGTQCSANAYGRNQGWAFNANKWVINAYGYNSTDIEQYFDIQKLFHLYKPINPIYGTKDPTISSNSWGYRSTSHRENTNALVPNYYFYRQGTSGGVGVAYTATTVRNSVTLNQGTIPNFMRYVGYYGDGFRMKGEHTPNSYLTAGKEMIDAGVIFIVASGNSNQKQVGPTHPDFNNYWSTNAQGQNSSLSNSTHSEFGVTAYNTTNRRGFPQQLGMYTDPGTGLPVYPAINIGALDDAFASNGKERKVNYSDMGEGIDCYGPADGTLTATNATSGYARPDTYSIGVSLSDTGTTGICSSSVELSGGSSFRTLLNTAKRITTASGSATVSNLTLSLLGSAALTFSTTPTTGNNDDGYWTLSLPFNISFNGTSYNTIYVGTNFYITFGGGSTVYNSISYSNPAFNKIMISARDNSGQRIYYGTEGVAPDRTYRVRLEGTASTGGTLGSPNMVYEAVFYENAPSQIDIHVGVNARVSTGTLVGYDSKFDGTSSACPVCAGLIATKLQHNRNWGWQDVRNWLSNVVGDANTDEFDTGVESTSGTDLNWANVNSLEGGRPIVIWDAITGNEPLEPPIITFNGTKAFSGNNLKITGQNLRILYQ